MLFDVTSALECEGAVAAQCEATLIGNGSNTCVTDEWPSTDLELDCLDEIEASTCDELESVYQTGNCRLLFDQIQCVPLPFQTALDTH